MSKGTATIAVCVFGSRSFNDYAVLKNTMQNLYPGSIAIISGKAIGADELGERYGNESCFEVRARKPDYRKHGQGAPGVRNVEMAKECDEAVGFWDGKSTGTKHMIKCLIRERKPFNIYRFDGSLMEHKSFKELHKPGCVEYSDIRKSDGWGYCSTHSKHIYLDPDDSSCLCDFCIEVNGTRKLQKERFDFGANETVIPKGQIHGKLIPLAPLVDIHKALTSGEKNIQPEEKPEVALNKSNSNTKKPPAPSSDVTEPIEPIDLQKKNNPVPSKPPKPAPKPTSKKKPPRSLLDFA